MASEKLLPLAVPGRCLSVRQPFAWLMAAGWKPIENRSWATGYGGLVAIHASTSRRHMTNELDLWLQKLHPGIRRELWRPNGQLYHFGAIIGVAELLDCVPYHQEHAIDRRNLEDLAKAVGCDSRVPIHHWAMGEVCWVFRDAMQFSTVIPCSGKLNLWKLSPELTAKVAEAMKHPLQRGKLAIWPERDE